MKLDLDYTERHIVIDLIEAEMKSIRSGGTSYGSPRDTAEMLTTLHDLQAKIMRGEDSQL